MKANAAVRRVWAAVRIAFAALRDQWPADGAFERLRISTRLILLVLALALPLNLVILSTIWTLARSAQEVQRSSLLYAGRLVARAVDAQLDRHRVLAVGLASSPALLDDDLTAFAAEARRVLSGVEDAWVIVADLEGQQILNLLAKPGQALPRRNAAAIATQEEAFATRSTVVGGVRRGPVAGEPVATIDVPVFKDGKPFRVLAVTMTTRGFLRLLGGQQIPNNWLAGIIDGDGRFVARVPGNDEHVGTMASEGWRAIRNTDGIYEFRSLEGDPIVQANVHSPESGWTVGIAIKNSELRTAAWSTVGWAAILGTALSLLSLAASVAIARRITRPLNDLRRHAAQVLEGTLPEPQAAPPEIDELARALRHVAAERVRADRALAQSEARFRGVFEHAMAGIVIGDDAGRLQASNPAFSALVGYSPEELHGITYGHLIHPDDRPRELAESAQLRRGEIVSFECESRYITKSGSIVWARKIVSRLPAVNGQPGALFMIAVDITKQKQAEEQIHLLVREVSHRSKNMLSVVQAIARNAARNADPITFADRLSERISALATGHDLLIRNEWRGANLADLVKVHLVHFQDLIGTRIQMAGPEVRVSPSAAQPLGMALHELATNAAKYGALSDTTGRIDVSWTMEEGANGATFAMEWREHDGPPVTPPSRTGFGHMLMVQLTERSLSGKVVLEFAPSGVVWHLTAPAARVVE